MPRVAVHLVRAFGRGPEGGNPAGVVLDAQDLSAAQKQAVAAKVGYSETAFVGRSSRADYFLEFFTPTKQIPNCGHATVAAFALLRQKGRVAEDAVTVETLNGVAAVGFEGELVLMEQKPAGSWELPEDERRAVLASLSLPEERLLPGFPPLLASTGNPFFLVGVREASDLAALRPDFAKIEALSAARSAVGYYAFAAGDGAGEPAATTRMFAPFYGIDEESATGMAAGPLAWQLRQRLGVSRARFLLEQGRFMSPPTLSTLEARLDVRGDAVAAVTIGGRGFIASETAVEA